MIAGASHMLRSKGARAAALAALLAFATPAAAGTWKYDVSRNDGHQLTFNEDGRVTFYLGCGRFFALQVKYPGEPKKEGKARITISSAKSTMTFDGEFVEPVKVDVPEPMDLATEFAQTYLGYARNDPRVYGKHWLAIRSRLYAMLGSGQPLTIAAGKSSYQLPPVDAANWRTPFERCGVSGDSW
jgi:hypothetical protein